MKIEADCQTACSPPFLLKSVQLSSQPARLQTTRLCYNKGLGRDVYRGSCAQGSRAESLQRKIRNFSQSTGVIEWYISFAAFGLGEKHFQEIIMAYTDRLRPNGVHFSDLKNIKGQGFRQLKYIKGQENPPRFQRNFFVLV